MNIASKVLPEELEKMVKYLKEKDGISSITEIQQVGVIKNADEIKLDSLAMCKVIEKENSEILLTVIGNELASATAGSEKQLVYCRILDAIQPYKDIMDIIMEEEYNNITLSVDDVSSLWQNSLYEDLADDSLQSLKEKAISFFRICGEAGIGKLYLGRRGLQTRFTFDRDDTINKMDIIHQDVYNQGEEIYCNMIDNKIEEDRIRDRENDTEDEKIIEDVVTLTVPYIDGRKARISVPKDSNADEVKYVSDMFNLFLTRLFGMGNN